MRRSVVILALVAVAAVGGVMLLDREATPDLTLGGPLFDLDPNRVETVMITRRGLQYRFDRLAGGGWSLSGAIEDYVDTPSMEALLRSVPAARAGALLPGTVPGDRRYEFNGPDAIRLRLFLEGGREESLAIGTINPVTGNYYASGAGREGCFPVAGALRDRLNTLPASVQAKTLLPPFAREAVTALTLFRGATVHEFRRTEDRWWLRLDASQPATSLASLPTAVQRYQQYYDDRSRTWDGVRWIRAENQSVGQLVYEVSETVVRDIVPPREAAARRDEWFLAPAWRRVVLRGDGLNPDTTAGSPDAFEIAFGPAIERDRVPALRRGNVLLTDGVAINLLEQDLAVLVAHTALDAEVVRADRLELFREGHRLLTAVRTDGAVTFEGRQAWRATFPPAPSEGADEDRHGAAQDLVIDLNRIPILTALPPTDDPAVLADTERVRVLVGWNDGRELVLEAGWLQPERVPGGAAVLAPDGDDARPCGLWEPATGKLLQIPGALVVTARSLRNLAGPTAVPD